MKKNFLKKLTAIMLVAMMAVGMLGVASAGTITVKDNGNDTTANHTYSVYQIFTGTYDSESGELSDVKWGEGLSDAVIATLGSDFVNAKDATAVATVVAGYADDSDALKAFVAAIEAYVKENSVEAVATVAAGTATSNLADGYYLVVDNGATSGSTNVISSNMVEVIGGDVTIDVKTSLPTVEKKVFDEETGTYEDLEDAEAGSQISFQLTGTVSSNLDDYDKYFYQFVDTLSETLTYDGNAKVMVGSTDITSAFTIKNENNVLTITCGDLTAVDGVEADSVITVSYTATLSADATAESTIENTVKVVYSSNPKDSESGDSNNDGTPDDPSDDTPEDKVEVITYDINLLKINGNSVSESDKYLANVEFELYSGTTKIDTYTTNANGELEITGLDAGTYTLKEVEASLPAGYEAIEFTVTISEDETGTVTVAGDNVAINNDVIEVTNYKGSKLPSTGGMGTTILYIVGGILVVGAGVTLIVRKRMQNEAE